MLLPQLHPEYGRTVADQPPLGRLDTVTWSSVLLVAVLLSAATVAGVRRHPRTPGGNQTS